MDNVQNSETVTNTVDTNTSSVQNTAATDNSESESNLQQQIVEALEEPVNAGNEENKMQEPKKEELKDNNSNKNCPDKFKNEDGSVNIDNILKSYKELEPLVQEKANWGKKEQHF